MTLPMDAEAALDGTEVDRTHHFEVLPGRHEARVCQRGSFTNESRRVQAQMLGADDLYTTSRVCCWLRFEAVAGRRYEVSKTFSRKRDWGSAMGPAVTGGQTPSKLYRFVLWGTVREKGQDRVIAECRH